MNILFWEAKILNAFFNIFLLIKKYVKVDLKIKFILCFEFRIYTYTNL